MKSKDSSDDLSSRLTNAMNSWKENDGFSSGSKSSSNVSTQQRILKNDSSKPAETKQNLDLFSQRIRISVSRAGKAGKTVTVVKGLESISKDKILPILKNVKQKISVGGRIDEKGVVEIQGDQVTFLLDYLIKAGFRDVKKG
jgi:translation initiation factor 1